MVKLDMSKKLTIELPEDLASFAEAKVASGAYGSLGEAVLAGVRGLKDQDEFIDRWVKEEVIPSHERWVAKGRPVLTEDEVFASVEAAIEEAARRKAS